MDRRDDRTLPSLSSLFGPPLPRPSNLGVAQHTQPSPFPPRTPSPHFSGILRPVNSLHNLPTYQPPGSAQPHPQYHHHQHYSHHPHVPSSLAPPVRDLPSLDKVHISGPPPTSHLNGAPPHNIFASAHAYRPAPPPASRYPPFIHGRTTSESTATTDAASNRSSAFSTSQATSMTDLSSSRSSTVSRSSAKIVNVREIPGEGECYIYEDGSYMRAVIGGERVNPAWGITKAGKPRKRLAKACMACREKKIKCEQGDPGDSRCGQCARTNRVCRIAQETRSSPEPDSARSSGMQSSSGRPTSQMSDDRLMMGQGLHDNSARKRTHDMLHLNGAPEPMVTTPTEEWPSSSTPSVRGESAGKSYFQDLATPTARMHVPIARRRTKQSSKGRNFSSPRSPQRVNAASYDMKSDPYLVDPEATIYFLELFFYYRNKGPYLAIPREPFLLWVRGARDKSVDDRMMLYSCMAFGSIYALDSSLRDCGATFYEIAFQLERQRSAGSSLQLVHARMAIVFYAFARGEFESAFEYTANAVRGLTMLRYQDENNVQAVADDKSSHEYGMNAEQLRECRRRTFWVVYMLDRYNSFSFGSMGLIHDQEVFLRMPCSDEQFLNGAAVEMPIFRGDMLHEPYSTRPGDMAMLADIVAVWGSVTSHAYASVNRQTNVYVEHYDRYFERTCQGMSNWVANLPVEFRYSHDNMLTALNGGYFSQFYIIHAIYCLVGMKLGRIGRVELLSDEVKRRNLRIAMFHARLYLSMISTLSKAIHANGGEDVDFALAQPFPGYAVINAVDILSSGGRAAALADMTNKELEAAKAVVEQKSNFWTISRKQQQLIDDRQGLLSAYGINSGHTTDRHRVPEAMERAFLPQGHDLVYETTDDLFFDVVLDENNREEDPLRILS